MVSMPYPQKVIKKVLRLYPLVPVNSRSVSQDTILPVGGGIDLQMPVFVPKGVSGAYSVYSMHRRPVGACAGPPHSRYSHITV